MHSFEQKGSINLTRNLKNRVHLNYLARFVKNVAFFLLKSCKYVHQSHIYKILWVQFWGVKGSNGVQNRFKWGSILGGKRFKWGSILGGKRFKTLNNFSRLYKYPLSENRALQGLYERIRVLNSARFCLVSEIDAEYQDIFCKKHA